MSVTTPGTRSSVSCEPRDGAGNLSRDPCRPTWFRTVDAPRPGRGTSVPCPPEPSTTTGTITVRSSTGVCPFPVVIPPSRLVVSGASLPRGPLSPLHRPPPPPVRSRAPSPPDRRPGLLGVTRGRGSGWETGYIPDNGSGPYPSVPTSFVLSTPLHSSLCGESWWDGRTLLSPLSRVKGGVETIRSRP